jgi:hypothetical protein
MPARTYSTEVYLTCLCPDCEGRKVGITLRKFRSLSRLPSPACEQVVPELVSGRDRCPSKSRASQDHIVAGVVPDIPPANTERAGRGREAGALR